MSSAMRKKGGGWLSVLKRTDGRNKHAVGDVKKHKLQSGWVDGEQLLLVFVFIGLVE